MKQFDRVGQHQTQKTKSAPKKKGKWKKKNGQKSGDIFFLIVLSGLF